MQPDMIKYGMEMFLVCKINC
uniref:Uncharacterized protein n=1 Tax=Anguilla anguilla TaxID=7936 RepID=A0A0E9V6W1_ANGAN